MRTRDDVRYIVHGNPVTRDDLLRLGEWLRHADGLMLVSHDMRRVIEKEFANTLCTNRRTERWRSALSQSPPRAHLGLKPAAPII
jgi:hypothetical protein